VHSEDTRRMATAPASFSAKRFSAISDLRPIALVDTFNSQLAYAILRIEPYSDLSIYSHHVMGISASQPTPYADLNFVLREFVTRAQNVLADNFIGAYLQGSFATGDFDMHSDVDFLVIIEEDISVADLPALQALHEEMFKLRSPWAQHLEGSYIPKGALRHLPSPPRKFLYLDNGSRELVRSNHDDSLVVYWVLRERGIALIGPEPHGLISSVSTNALRGEILETMRTWREHLLAEPNRLNNRWRQTSVVVSYCRMLNTLQSGTVESKAAAVAWAQEALDDRWRQLIQGAWNDRPDPSLKVHQRADPADVERTREFMQYAIDLSQQPKDGTFF
jgi:hypothetical protein